MQYARNIHLVNLLKEETKLGDSIVFGGQDLMEVQLPHFDSIIITANIKSVEVRRLLVDNKSFRDIFFLKAFARMGIKPKKS